MTPYMSLLLSHFVELLESYVKEENNDKDLWLASISTLSKSFAVDDGGQYSNLSSPKDITRSFFLFALPSPTPSPPRPSFILTIPYISTSILERRKTPPNHPSTHQPNPSQHPQPPPLRIPTISTIRQPDRLHRVHGGRHYS